MEKVDQALQRCPICNEELKDVIIDLQFIPRKLFLRQSFCPNCKIVRSSFFGIYTEFSFPGATQLPFHVCRDCGSVWFAQKVDPFVSEKEKKCWLCGGVVEPVDGNKFEKLNLKQLPGLKRSEQINEWMCQSRCVPSSTDGSIPIVVIKSAPKRP